jgi:hypothetical protein
MVHHFPMVEEADTNDSFAKKIVGAVGGPFEKAALAERAREKGEYGRMVEAAMPNFIANPMKAYRMASKGPTTLSGREIMGEDLQQKKLSTSEAILQGVGVQPVRLSEEQEQGKFVRKQIEERKGQTDKLATGIARAIKTKDTESYKSLMDQVTQYNQKMVKAGRYADIITNESLKASIKNRMAPVYPEPPKKMMLRKQKVPDDGTGFLKGVTPRGEQ